jgi:diadenosine tetraphosphate (Ap4A) HIT family hydrolase
MSGAPFDAGEWERRTRGDGCPLCGPPERLVVAELPSGRVELMNDADFRGYCVLVHRRHAAELHHLTPEERGRFFEDVARVERALADLFAPPKFNIEMLGNMVPHLHCHIVPRYPDDGWWGQPLWLRPAEAKREYTPDEYRAVANRIQQALQL